LACPCVASSSRKKSAPMANLLIVALLLTLSRPLAAEGIIAPVMRHQPKAVVELFASGDFEELEDRESPGETRSDDTSCRNSYLLGKTGTNECEDDTLETLIDTVAACELAADEAGAARGDVNDTKGAAHGKFVDGLDLQLQYPKGCYKVGDPLNLAAPGSFFFNPSLHDPTHPGKHGARCRRA